jgi:hypothetical protein
MGTHSQPAHFVFKHWLCTFSLFFFFFSFSFSPILFISKREQKWLGGLRQVFIAIKFRAEATTSWFGLYFVILKYVIFENTVNCLVKILV